MLEALHILVVEDDEVTRAKLSGYLEAAGHRVSEAADGEGLWRVLERDPADLILLDINLPGEDGLDLTRRIRVRSNVGVILVTGRTDQVDRILGLEIGADDYVTKPFNSRELLARVKALLRRSGAGGMADSPIRRFAGWSFNLTARKLTAADGRSLSLTRAEFELLRALVEHWRPEWVVGVGAFAEKCAQRALDGGSLNFGRVLHPSPASPAANRGWAEQAERQMIELGLWS